MKSENVESHEVVTEDGYILTLLRVRGQLKCEDDVDTRKHPVLLVHGLISCGTHWFMNTPQKDLPHILVEEGYDCWIANLRGTPLSRSHAKVHPDSTKFWDFSWHEMAKFDIPAMMKYVLEVNGSDQLSYIGHSMGCSVFFASMTLNPELQKNVRKMIALAPAVYGRNIRNPLARLSIPIGTFLGRLRSFYAREIFPMTLIAYAKKFLPYLTLNPERVGGWILRTFGRHAGVLGRDQICKIRFRHIATELPSPTSLKTFCHGTQCFTAGRFQHYDYGKIGNMRRYGDAVPPKYDLSAINVPIATFYSTGDQLCSLDDVSTLAKEFPKLISNYGVFHNEFAHTDFMFGKDADNLVYKEVMRLIQLP